MPSLINGYFYFIQGTQRTSKMVSISPQPSPVIKPSSKSGNNEENKLSTVKKEELTHGKYDAIERVAM